MVKKSIDYAMNEFGKNIEVCVIDLSGSGEPLLNFNLIKKIEEYCEKIRSEKGIEIKIMFPTNATLLDEQMAKYFTEKPNILLGVSIDGNRRQCVNRKCRNNEEAYFKIHNGIKLLNKRTIGAAVTITDKNYDIDNVFNSIYDEYKNIDAISMQIVRDFDKSSKTSFYNINIKKLLEHYRLLTKNIITHLNNNDDDYLFVLLRGADLFGTYILRAINKGVLMTSCCGAGKNRFAFDENGNIYACTVVTGNKHFLIGNIENGIDNNKQKRFYLKNTEESKKCRECWAAYICGGECFASAYLANNDIYMPNEIICDFKRELIKISINFALYLKENKNEIYKKVERFIITKSLHETFSDSGLWAIQTYFNMKKIKMENSKLIKEVKQDEHGVTPVSMQEFIKKYEHSFESFEIDNINNYKNLKYPLIAYVNKKQSMFYEYLIVEGIDGDILKIKSKKNCINIPIKVFNRYVSSIVMMK